MSALTACSLQYKQVLPTTKFDGNPLLRKEISNMKREIAILYNETKGKGVTVSRSTPLGKYGLEMMLSAFRVSSEAAFNNLCRRDRHELNAATMQHGVAMRFGHFLYRKYTISSLSFGADGAIRLITDWHRYSGMRRYCLTFPALARFKCLRYDVRDPRGNVLTAVSASTILR